MVLRWGKREIGLYIYRYTVTTRMTPALRWAAILRAILMFHLLWGTKSQDSVHRGERMRIRTEIHLLSSLTPYLYAKLALYATEGALYLRTAVHWRCQHPANSLRTNKTGSSIVSVDVKHHVYLLSIASKHAPILIWGAPAMRGGGGGGGGGGERKKEEEEKKRSISISTILVLFVLV